MLDKIVLCLLALFVQLYTYVTLPIYAVIQKPWKTKKAMRRNRANRVPSTDGICIRQSVDLHPLQLELLENQLDTLPKVFYYACNKYSNKLALGTREIFGECDELQKNGTVLKKLDMGEYKWLTFKEAETIMRQFGNGMRHLGLIPNKRIVIYADTSKEWLLSAMGAFQQGCIICTLYTTLNDDAMVHCTNETEVELIITNTTYLDKVKAILPKCPNVKNIICLPDPCIKKTHFEQENGCKIYTFHEVINEGKINAYEDCIPTKEDIAIIMYTSGSTGTPKGVLMSHRNVITSMVQFVPLVDSKEDDLYIAYLPLAHVLELFAECIILYSGLPIGYSTPLTLTDVSIKIMAGQKGDANILKPTIFMAVPLILDRIFKAATEKVAAKGPVSKIIFDYFVNYRLSWFKAGWKTPLCNRLIFNKTRELLGGRMTKMGVGGAPLSVATHDLMRAILGINVCQGYALTETCASATLMDRLDDFSTGRVGVPLNMTDVKVIDWQEGGYTIHDKPNPRGEIVIGGGCVSEGYFKNSSMTKESFYEIDGQRWFRTGDIGEIYSNGTVGIIDRKKDILKLQMGEYISLGKIESILKLCPIVDNICIYGKSSDMKVVAIVSINVLVLANLEKELNVSFSSEIGKCLIKAATLKSLSETGKKANLSSLEIPKDCYITDEVWTPENKLLTASMKIKRKNIEIQYKQEIEKLYHS